MAKVYYDLSLRQPAMRRIMMALHQYKPDGLELVKSWKEADVVVVNINGRIERNTAYIDKIVSSGKRYIIIQYSLRSTRNPHTDEWIPLWEGAEFVWSYLLLNHEMRKDGNERLDNLYITPLGVDPTTFIQMDRERSYGIIATGYNYLSQSAKEVIGAANQAGVKMAYLGPNLNKPGVDYYTDISDHHLAVLYNRCKYVSGLRRNEGFELPAAEGLLCGAQPLVFDRPDHRKWYDGLAIFVDEKYRKQIANDVADIIQNEPTVTQEQIDEARHRFDWENIIGGFWSRI